MGRKLTLDVDTLAVSSFETTTVDDARGTVQGREDLAPPSKYSCNNATYCCQTANTCTTNLC